MTYQYHLLSKHTPENQKPYHCKVCNKGFIKSEALKEHGYIHTGEAIQLRLLCQNIWGQV